MPLVSMLISALAAAAGNIAGKAFISLGIGFASYAAMKPMVDWLRNQCISLISGSDVVIIQMLSTLKVDQCISICFSAVLAKITLNGIASASKKMVMK